MKPDTHTQSRIIEDINHIVEDCPILLNELSTIIPEECDTYESWSDELWNKVDTFLLEKYYAVE